MNVQKVDPLAPRDGTETPPEVALNRRKWLKRAASVGVAGGLIAGGVHWGSKRLQGTDEQVFVHGEVAEVTTRENVYPANREQRFTYGRDETERAEAARYTNFYEFSRYKFVWRFVDDFKPLPWKLSVVGLCQKPFEIDFEDLLRRFASSFRERQYRHRCVETWAMAVPWTGFQLSELIKAAEPMADATHVRFVSFMRPDEATNQETDDFFPWPYVEGLTMEEATNELTFLATGMYGEPLLKQHGAPLRLVVPWKYGYKSIKSIERIEIIGEEPLPFWTEVKPHWYPFRSNVDPSVPVPWNQSRERMLGTGEQFKTEIYNGYGEYVAHLY
jgi:sulfoxide reductase catalytic subunit YedY